MSADGEGNAELDENNLLTSSDSVIPISSEPAVSTVHEEQAETVSTASSSVASLASFKWQLAWEKYSTPLLNAGSSANGFIYTLIFSFSFFFIF